MKVWLGEEIKEDVEPVPEAKMTPIRKAMLARLSILKEKEEAEKQATFKDYLKNPYVIAGLVGIPILLLLRKKNR